MLTGTNSKSRGELSEKCFLTCGTEYQAVGNAIVVATTDGVTVALGDDGKTLRMPCLPNAEAVAENVTVQVSPDTTDA